MYLGLDIGTTAVKAILLDGAERILAEASVEHPTARPAPGLNEQDPDSWIAAAEKAMAAARSAAPEAFAAVRAIGLSGQMHSPVLLDRDRRPVRPAMLWNDARGGAECAALAAAVPDIGAITGVVPMVGFSAAKILWVRRHEPDAFRRIAHLLLPKDYVRLWLTGELASDVSDAAGTQLLDERRRTFSPAMLDAVGLSPDQAPALLDGDAVAGRLRSDVASTLGLKPGVPVAAGGGDAATGAVGVGCVGDRDGFISLGTAAVFVVARDRYQPRPELILHNFAHCVPGRWYQMAGMLNGASCLAWALKLIGEGDAGAFLAEVEARHRGPARATFLPYLNGERTPHNNPAARGVLFGLDAAADRHDLVQAVLEGVAFSIREADESLAAADSFCAAPGFIGGGARSRLWARIVATVIGRPVRRFAGGALGPALGAARLAIAASTARPVEQVAPAPATADLVEPDVSLRDAYAERYEKYRALYRAVRGLY